MGLVEEGMIDREYKVLGLAIKTSKQMQFATDLVLTMDPRQLSHRFTMLLNSLLLDPFT